MIELPPHGDRRSRHDASVPAAARDFRRRASEVEVVSRDAVRRDAEDQRKFRQEVVAAYEYIAKLD